MLTLSLVAMQSWESLKQLRSISLLSLKKWLVWNISGLLLSFKVLWRLVYLTMREGNSHLPFCSRCTPAARRSGSPRLMSFSLVPRHSIQRCLHHSSASSSENDHTPSESSNAATGRMGEHCFPDHFCRELGNVKIYPKHTKMLYSMSGGKIPTIISHCLTLYFKVI